MLDTRQEGSRGIAASPRTKRAALMDLTIDLALAAYTTIDLLRQVVGLWTDVLLYRRDHSVIARKGAN